jgi:hypothetical protein
MTTVPLINKALAARGIKVRIVRNLLGGSYYYFIDDGFDVVPSIYQYTLRDCTTESVVRHVITALEAA